MTKPARFIFDSDCTTLRVTGEQELAITIPNDILLHGSSSDPYVIGTRTYTVPNKSDSFYFYFSSSVTDYTCMGWYGSTAPVGSYVDRDGDIVHTPIRIETNVAGNTLTFQVEASYLGFDYTRYVGYGQTLTLHIITFKDPFSE